MNIQWYESLLDEVSREIERGNKKHGHARIATDIETVVILLEELGEYAQAVMKGQKENARNELIQVCAVAFNRLTEKGPHFSSL